MESKPDLKNPGGCEILRAGPCGVVIFGASGHLAHRKLFPSLFRLYKNGGLARESFIAGAARTKMSDAEFRVSARKAVMEAGLNPGVDELDDFCSNMYYFQLEYGAGPAYEGLKAGLGILSQKHKTGGNVVFVFAVPPGVYMQVIEGLGKSGLINKKQQPFSRIMVEKPFGRDLESAELLNSRILEFINEEQVFRVDHYLGKNTVQNILAFRFANMVFSPVWNNRHVDSVQIIFSEETGVGGRAGYFEQAGIIRDVMQNHMLQLLALAAMERPASFTAEAVQEEKVKVLRDIRPVEPDKPDGTFIRGQYTKGKSSGVDAAGYREEFGVNKDSCVETFFASKLFIDNERWRGVPFYMKAGKRLDKSRVKICVIFKDGPDCIFCGAGAVHEKNMLTFEIQPAQGIALKFNAKVPGPGMCLKPNDMDFKYDMTSWQKFGNDYENIILDCLAGEHTLFWRRDALEESWKYLTPLLRWWESCSVSQKSKMMFFYPAGSRGPKEADEFIARDGRAWVE